MLVISFIIFLVTGGLGGLGPRTLFTHIIVLVFGVVISLLISIFYMPLAGPVAMAGVWLLRYVDPLEPEEPEEQDDSDDSQSSLKWPTEG